MRDFGRRELTIAGLTLPLEKKKKEGAHVQKRGESSASLPRKKKNKRRWASLHERSK